MVIPEESVAKNRVMPMRPLEPPLGLIRLAVAVD
jgi:hypothetical protein